MSSAEGCHESGLVEISKVIGAICLSVATVLLVKKYIQVVRLYIISRHCFRSDYRKKYGQWAVISGATDGIGLSMARELAKRGMSIVVLGRDETKLANARNLLESQSKVGEVVTIKTDLADPSQENFDKIREQLDLENRDIGILVNNAGISSKGGHFADLELTEARDIVNIHIMAMIQLTHMVLPTMLKRKKGLVVNVTSLLGLVPSAYSGVYGPSKTFLSYFTRQLRMEYKSSSVEFIELSAGPVDTKLLRMKIKPSFIAPTPDSYAASAIDALSTGIGRMSGCLTHGFLKELIEWADRTGLNSLVTSYSLRAMKVKPYKQEAEPKARKQVDEKELTTSSRTSQSAGQQIEI